MVSPSRTQWNVSSAPSCARGTCPARRSRSGHDRRAVHHHLEALPRLADLHLALVPAAGEAHQPIRHGPSEAQGSGAETARARGSGRDRCSAATAAATASGGGQRRRPRLAEVLVQEAGMKLTCLERGVADDACRRARLVTTPRTRVRRSAADMRSHRLGAVPAPGDELGQQRVVVDRDLGARGDAGSRSGRRGPRAPRGAGCGRAKAGRRCRGPRRRAGTPGRGRGRATSACAIGSGRPAATSIWRRTMSRPVTASVTGCSTCRRVFISRK